MIIGDCVAFKNYFKEEMKEFYVWLYLMTIVFRYLELGCALGFIGYKIEMLKTLAIWFPLWILSVIVFNGCIFSHI